MIKGIVCRLFGQLWVLVDLDVRMLQSFFHVRFRIHNKIKTVKGGDDKIKTVTSDGTQQNKNTDVTGSVEDFS